MRSLVLFLLAIGLGALSVSGQDTGRRSALEKAIEDATRLLEEHGERELSRRRERVIHKVYDVGDLVSEVRDAYMEPSNLYVSKLKELECEDTGPSAPFGVDMIVELARQVCYPSSWDEIEGAQAEIRSGRIFVSHVPRVHAAFARLLEQLRAAAFARIAVDIVAVRVDPAFAAMLYRHPRALPEEEAKKLLAQDALGRARLVCRNGQQLVARSGRVRSYLADYDVEIAKDSTIGSPIRSEIFEGCAAEVRAGLDRGGRGAVLHFRLDQSQVDEPVRRLETEHGPMDMPVMQLTRLRGSVWAPLGKAVVLGGCTAGEHTCIFVATARLLEGE